MTPTPEHKALTRAEQDHAAALASVGDLTSRARAGESVTGTELAAARAEVELTTERVRGARARLDAAVRAAEDAAYAQRQAEAQAAYATATEAADAAVERAQAALAEVVASAGAVAAAAGRLDNPASGSDWPGHVLAGRVKAALRPVWSSPTCDASGMEKFRRARGF